MSDLGGLEQEEIIEEKQTDNAAGKDKKLPWHVWHVGECEYKLKLTTANILKLENKYRCNVTALVTEADVPPLSIMLTIINAAMLPYHHGISYQDTQKIYDKWLEEGGNQQELYRSVILPIMSVSGFFTEKQKESILQMMADEV